MKVQLTHRKTVEAISEWFTVNVDPTRVTVRTDFGYVTIRRTSSGLEVDNKLLSADAFVEIETADGKVSRNFDVVDTHTIKLRTLGLTRLDEIQSDKELDRHVQDWLRRKKEVKS